MTKNRQDLSRSIPEPVKREVRQRDGFGCIVCGSAFYQYDHLGIEFKDAELHDPNKIVLLCGGCHDRKNRGTLSTETLLRHSQSPFCKQENFSRGAMDIGINHPEIVFGTLTATNVRSLLTIDGEDVFSISPPEAPNRPFRINASLYDKDGRPTLKIVNNEFQASSSNWDVEVVGTRVTIRSASGVFDLIMRVEPPHRVIIERLDMIYKNFSIQCREGLDTTIESSVASLRTSGTKLSGCDIAILVSGSSLSMGVGGGVMYIDSMVSGPIGIPNRLSSAVVPPPQVQKFLKQGRNEQCNCGSGKKYKRCHGFSN